MSAHLSRTATGVVTVFLITSTLVYRHTSRTDNRLSHRDNDHLLIQYSKELSALRDDFYHLNQRIVNVEHVLSSSFLTSRLVSWLDTTFSKFTVVSSSFLLYTFFLYLFHLSVIDASSTHTIKLLHIVNIICYSLISIVYTSLKHVHYSNLAWLLFILLFIRLCIR